MPEKHDNAVLVAWESPGGLIMALARLEADEGSVLTAAIDGGAVTISGKNCQYAVNDAERERKGKKPSSVHSLSEFQFTVPLSRCQIVWKYVETSGAEQEHPHT